MVSDHFQPTILAVSTLAAHGATLTPLARLERRVPTLYVKNEEEKGDARAFARELSGCVSDQQPESYDLSSLAATYVDNSAPLPRCLRNKVLRGVPFVFFVGASMCCRAPRSSPSMWPYRGDGVLVGSTPPLRHRRGASSEIYAERHR